MCRLILNWIIRDEYGATAIEYALLAALISVAAIGVLSLLGDSLG
ncbi:MAG: Flp family type IVb pilin, partial [Rhodospirillales bacterium]